MGWGGDVLLTQKKKKELYPPPTAPPGGCALFYSFLCPLSFFFFFWASFLVSLSFFPLLFPLLPLSSTHHFLYQRVGAILENTFLNTALVVCTTKKLFFSGSIFHWSHFSEWTHLHLVCPYCPSIKLLLQVSRSQYLSFRYQTASPTKQQTRKTKVGQKGVGRGEAFTKKQSTQKWWKLFALSFSSVSWGASTFHFDITQRLLQNNRPEKQR